MKKILLLVANLLLLSSLYAQDTIFKKNGDEIQAKVLEVLPDLVKYKIYTSQDGPTYSTYKSDILLIKYEDGRKDIFEENKKHNEGNEILPVKIVKGNTKLEYESSSFIDSRDNQEYKTVKIGKQIWLAENLNYLIDNSYCYEDKPEYCDKYGRLYSWIAATNACPDGWHLPSDEEWKELEVELGMQNEVDEVGWRGKHPGQGFLMKKGGGSGFNAELAGYVYLMNGDFFKMLGDEGYFWTSTQKIDQNKKSWYRRLTGRASIERENMSNKRFGMSVRCVKD